MMRRITLIILIGISCFLVACDSADNNQSSESIIEQEVVSNVMEDDNNQYSETYVDDEQESISINVPTNDIEKESVLEEELSFWKLMNNSKELSDEDKECLQRFYPIFCENKEFTLVGSEWNESRVPEVVSFEDIYKVIAPYEYEAGYTELKYLERFTLNDLTGDGKKELVICVRDLGDNVIVFQENNNVYNAAIFGIRSMHYIYINGIYRGSGSATSYGYFRMKFVDGYLFEETIARHICYDVDGEVLIETEVCGQKVTEDEFAVWESENIKEMVEWNYVETSKWN